MSETTTKPTDEQQKHLLRLANLALATSRKNAIHMLTENGKPRMLTTHAIINEAMEAFGLSARVVEPKPKAKRKNGAAR